MPSQSKVIAFDVDRASLLSLRKALPDSVIEVVNGATAASLTRDWNPGTVDLLVVVAREDLEETLRLCRFLVSCFLWRSCKRVPRGNRHPGGAAEYSGTAQNPEEPEAAPSLPASCLRARRAEEHRKGRAKGGCP